MKWNRMSTAANKWTKNRRGSAMVFWSLLLSASALADQPFFMGLGNLPGSYGQAMAVSADGSTVVGGSYFAPGEEAWRWRSGVITGLGDLSPGERRSYAYAVSADGSVVVGSGGGQGSALTEAFRWQSGVMAGLGYLSGIQSVAYGVSADGSVVVGGSGTAFRWESGTMVDLGTLPGSPGGSTARGVSADGSVVVGGSGSALGAQAFRWENGIMTGLGDLPGGAFSSEALAVSADGSVVVGNSSSSDQIPSEAFRWEAGVMTGLGGVPGLFASSAYGVSADGSVVVGRAHSDSGFQAFIWDTNHGLRRLQDVLANELGLDLTSWGLFAATGVSSDGLTIVGYGSSDGIPQAWIARLPEPGTLAAFGVGAVMLLGWRRGAA